MGVDAQALKLATQTRGWHTPVLETCFAEPLNLINYTLDRGPKYNVDGACHLANPTRCLKQTSPWKACIMPRGGVARHMQSSTQSAAGALAEVREHGGTHESQGFAQTPLDLR